MQPAHQHMGPRIAQARKKRHMTQKQLAEKLHVTDKAVSKWERGAGYPDIATLPALATALGVPISHLIGGAPDENASSSQTDEAVQYTMAYIQQIAQAQQKKALRHTFTLCSAILLSLLIIAAAADKATSGHFIWSTYAWLTGGYLWLSLVPLCLLRRHGGLISLITFCALLLPYLYGMLAFAGAQAWFVPLALPMGLMALFYVLTLSMAFLMPHRGWGWAGGALTVILVLLPRRMDDWLAYVTTGQPFSLTASDRFGALCLFGFLIALCIAALKQRKSPRRPDDLRRHSESLP